MYKVLIILAFMLCSCVVAVPIKKSVPRSNEAMNMCYEYCSSNFRLSWRNKHTYFCECLAGRKMGQIVVISKGGTIYK
jgi:hypothetical protein